ncbi:MAG: hypothetical protein ABW215_21895 [Kibdelosporangium sp.]
MTAGFATAVAEAAEAVATLLGANQIRGTGRYPLGEVLPGLNRQLRILQEAVDGFAGPLPADLAAELAAFMSHLQLLRVLYHGIEDFPDSLRVNASRDIAGTNLAARRVRDRARRLAKQTGRPDWAERTYPEPSPGPYTPSALVKEKPTET